MTALVCIPTYNEAENIAGIVDRVLRSAPDVRILVVDDDSPDGTGAVVDGLTLRDPRVSALHRSARQGLGAAYRAAFSWALRHGHDVVVEMDADGSHRPEELPRLLSALGDADVAVGSRWIPGGGVVGWPFSRRLLSRGGSLYARLALGIEQRDATSGYRAYRADAVRRIGFAGIESTGYAFQIEMLRGAVREGLRIVEVPITFEDRRLGTSKMSTRIVAEAVVRTTLWGVADLPDRLSRAARGRSAAPAAAATATATARR